MNSLDFDIIGDIHGHADALERLLQKLGYTRKFGVYSHPHRRKVVFVGDFIDRGPKIRETLHLVRDMVESGNALAVMGNHEFNAISFHTPHTESGGFFRDHTVKEIRQHLETMDQFQHYDLEFSVFLEWFKTLPLYLDMGRFRVVHACWDDQHIKYLEQHYQGITADFLNKGNNKKDASGMYRAVDETLKGIQRRLPENYSFIDKDGAERHECRIRWWRDPRSRHRLKDVLIDCPDELGNMDILNGDSYHAYTAPNPPVFFGHYWLMGSPMVENPSAVCLDYSVAKGGVLVACRLGERKGEMTKTLIY
ncbi:metallophosphoesterase [Flavihumibacter fluvii]|uniref:metallophosphoesterase n=1 Tax=Flavihumibacter fluvii TaxID=2838157 RepID=UPI001BDE5E93|nr:metallophosphoesterase [Flavihumibacter fluvii]ULQ50899.1 metallophosphoesterase [Flavihumibacter fluvii]